MSPTTIILLTWLISLHAIFYCNAESRNLALGRPTQQSSVRNYQGHSRNAVDGNRNPTYENGHCSQTAWSFPSWWLLDLEDTYVITAIQITNRDHEWWRLANFSVEVSLKSPFHVCTGFPGKTNCSLCVREDGRLLHSETRFYHCETSILGRYLRVFKYTNAHDDRTLALCEFEVFGPPVWTFKVSSDVTDSPDIIQTISGLRSKIECAKECAQHEVGYDRCRFIQMHIPSGVCQLMRSPPARDKTANPDWVSYQVTGR